MLVALQRRLEANKTQAVELQEAVQDYSMSSSQELLTCSSKLAELHHLLSEPYEERQHDSQRQQLPQVSSAHPVTGAGLGQSHPLFCFLWCFCSMQMTAEVQILLCCLRYLKRR